MPYRTLLDVLEALCRGRRVRAHECPHAVIVSLVKRVLIHATLTSVKLTNNAKLLRDSMLRESSLTPTVHGDKPLVHGKRKPTRSQAATRGART